MHCRTATTHFRRSRRVSRAVRAEVPVRSPGSVLTSRTTPCPPRGDAPRSPQGLRIAVCGVPSPGPGPPLGAEWHSRESVCWVACSRAASFRGAPPSVTSSTHSVKLTWLCPESPRCVRARATGYRNPCSRSSATLRKGSFFKPICWTRPPGSQRACLYRLRHSTYAPVAPSARRCAQPRDPVTIWSTSELLVSRATQRSSQPDASVSSQNLR